MCSGCAWALMRGESSGSYVQADELNACIGVAEHHLLRCERLGGIQVSSAIVKMSESP